MVRLGSNLHQMKMQCIFYQFQSKRCENIILWKQFVCLCYAMPMHTIQYLYSYHSFWYWAIFMGPHWIWETFSAQIFLRPYFGPPKNPASSRRAHSRAPHSGDTTRAVWHRSEHINKAQIKGTVSCKDTHDLKGQVHARISWIVRCGLKGLWSLWPHRDHNASPFQMLWICMNVLYIRILKR